MIMYKDVFSKQSKNYIKFRPRYPEELYSFIYKVILLNQIQLNHAWDVGTGNGQVASELAKTFKLVFATDISENQLKYAIKKENIIYKLEPAENTSLQNNSIDLITVAQALHWFNIPAFFREVYRVAKRPSLIAIWFYHLLEIEKNIYDIFLHLYKDVLGEYWEPERKLIESNYDSIYFPFKDIRRHRFNLKLQWTKETFLGYISTWSSYQKYKEIHFIDPLIEFKKNLDLYWMDEELKEVSFPIHLIYSIIT